MKQVDKWWCPDLLSGPGNYMSRLREVEPVFAALERRRVAVQAGGHIGVWPSYLASLFGAVYTFEPELENFTALTRNLSSRSNVFAARGLLGNDRGARGLLKSAKSTGQHRVKGDGDFPVYRIDDLELENVDLIALDVEGFEIPALRGALDTIKRCRPTIVAEENRRAEEQGFKIGDLASLLMGMGYAKAPKRIREDLVFVP